MQSSSDSYEAFTDGGISSLLKQSIRQAESPPISRDAAELPLDIIVGETYHEYDGQPLMCLKKRDCGEFCGMGFQPVKKHGQDGRATSR